MNDEIKEINIKIPGQILDYVDTKEHLLDLFNYITNLQEDVRTGLEINSELQQENERLKQTQYVWSYDLDMQLEDYKSRCDKAIEYIDKQKKKMYKSRNKIAMFILMKLENILQNGSEKDDK